MNLMLKQMQQKPVHPLMLNTCATMHLNDALQTMGYRRTLSMDGGWRRWTELRYPVDRD